MTFETLLKGHRKAEILCAIKGTVVRTLTRIGEDGTEEPITPERESII
jgi:hypothetical protein